MLEAARDTSLATRSEPLSAQVLRRLRDGLANPLAFPGACISVIALIRRTASARRCVQRAMEPLTADRTVTDLSTLRRWFARYFNLEEARLFAETIAEGRDLDAVRQLREAIERRTSPSPDLYRLARNAEVSLGLLQQGWRAKQRRAAPGSREAAAAKRSLLVFHSRGPLVNNGYAARSLEILQALAKSGWQTESVTRLGFPNDINRYRTADMALYENYGGAPCRLLKDEGDGQRGRPLDDYLREYEDRLVAEVERFRPSVLHAASNYINALPAINAARRTGVACIYEVRGLWEVTAISRGDYGAEDARFRLAKRLETDAARAADRVITLSEGLKRELVARGVEAERIGVVPNCVDVEAFARGARDGRLMRDLQLGPAPLIGYFGAFVDYEGLDRLIEAIGLLDRKGVEIQALFVGGGPAEAGLKAQAKKLGLAKRIRFVEKVPREEAERYARLADIVALPRRDLPVTRIVPPIKAVEAMARGQALVVSKLPALTDIIEHGVSGLAVEGEDAQALADAIGRLARDETLRRRLGVNAQARAREHFDISVAGRKIAAVYEEALA